MSSNTARMRTIFRSKTSKAIDRMEDPRETLDDNYGEDPVGNSLERIDPLVSHYDAALNKLGEQDFFQKTVEQLFEQYPFEESRPPFALGERRPGES